MLFLVFLWLNIDISSEKVDEAVFGHDLNNYF